VDELAVAITTLDPADPVRDHPSELTQAPTGIVTFLFDDDADPATPPLAKLDMADIVDEAASYDGSGRVDVRFGQGPQGELWIMSKRNGWIYLVTNSLPSDPEPSGSCAGNDATVIGLVGTPGDDVIVGTSGDDVILGFGGDDVLCGGDGNDVIDGGDGADELFGAGGHDRLFGRAGDDLVDGGVGRDVLRGGDGHDRLFGGTGNDRLSGNAGRDMIRAGNGRDKAFGNSGVDQLYGGGGHDRLDGGSGADSAVGGAGVDECTRVLVTRRCER
ncbi:MAG: calcium-binding protein, partial [Acidimicrobiales bacterium]